MGLDLNALQELMSKVNSSTLADAMAAYFNGSANASVAFAMLDPESAAAINNMLNGTDLSSFIGSSVKSNTTGSSSSGMTGLSPTPMPSVNMPPLPRPGIFDAPSNPYLDGLDTGNSTLSSLMAGLSPEAQARAQVMLVNEMIKAAKSKAFEISMLLLLGYALVLVFNAVLILHIRYNRHLATKGDSTAARKIVLPAFEPLLWAYVVILVAYIAFWGATIRTDFMTVQSTFVTIEMAYACKQVLYLLVPINMMQKSLSVPALFRSIGITFVASFYTVPIVWLMQDYGRDDQQLLYYWILWTSRWLTFLPFIYVCIWPPARASARAFREYLFFYVVVQMLYLAACEIFHQGGSIDLGTRFGWASACWVGVLPFFIWRVIRADTEHWRGIGKRAVELQTLFRRKGGVVEERISAKGLHVLIEMHRKFIIDFANLDIQHKIGEGTNSIVFRGRLNAQQLPVAIKMFTPPNVNEDVVAEFSHEAALCGALQHPNILTFYGMCVCPPTIGFVTELCQGSLHDITTSMAKKAARNPHRQQFLINIGYMIDAARAVAYLHSFSPPYVHRDIRPSSFQVDVEGTVKLTDFGASRTLSVRTANVRMAVPSNMASGGIVTRAGSQTVLAAPQMQPVRNEIPHDVKRTPEYMAPEVIRSKNAGASMYGEAADIYALAMTMWDILYPGAPKYTSSVHTEPHRDSYNQRETEIFDCVFAGHRPAMDEHVYSPLRELIQSSWRPDPRMRPRASHIVKALEKIQEETCAAYASELIDELDCSAIAKSMDVDASAATFQGARAIERMYALQHVAAECEGVRLGNMFMDAGFLHHIKHARSFEYSAALYLFDERAIHQCQPLAMLEDGANSRHDRHGKKTRRGGRNSHVSSDGGQGDAIVDHLHLTGGLACACSCRKLGQKLESLQQTRSRLRLKFKSNDENLVTARLLADEPNDDFEAFQDQHAQDAQVGRLP